MASDLKLGILVSASTGAAKTALKTTGQAMEGLRLKADAATRVHAGLGKEIAALRTKGTSVEALQTRYDRLGQSIAKVRTNLQHIEQAEARAQAHRSAASGLFGEAIGVAAVGATMLAPVKAAVNFESAMAEVKKVVEGSDAELNRLGRTLRNLSTDGSTSAEGLARIAASGGQLGVAIKDLPKFTETVAKMGVAFDMLPEQAGATMAKLSNIFELPIQNLGKLGDIINTLSNAAATNAADVSNVLLRTGSIGKLFGLSVGQVAALGTAMLDLGKTPEVAATGINALLNKLATAETQSKDFQAALGFLGTSAAELKTALGKDAQGALTGFLKTLRNVPKADRLTVLSQLFGAEYSDDIASLVEGISKYDKALNNLSNTEGSLDKEYNARLKTTAEQMKILGNTVNVLSISIGSTLLPAINDVVKSIKPVVGSMVAWAEANPEVVGGIAKLGAGLVAFKAASLGARAAYHLLGFGMWKTVARWGALRGAISSVGLAIRAGSLAPLIGESMVATKSVGLLAGLFKTLGKAGWATFRGIGQGAIWAGGLLGTTLTTIGRLGMAAFVGIGKALLTVGRLALANPVGLLVTGLALGGIWVYRNWGLVKEIFQNIRATIKDGFGRAIQFVKPFADYVASLPGKFLDFGGQIISGLIKGIQSRIGAAVEVIRGMGASIRDTFADLLGIRSPSRVFRGFGASLSDGLALGVEGGTRGVKNAAKVLGAAAIPVLSAPAAASPFPHLPVASVPAVSAAPGFPATTTAGAGIHFHTDVTVHGGGDKMEIQTAVEKAMKMSLRDFQDLMRQYHHTTNRTGYR